ncbi:MAG: hypothetical protein IIV23_02715, partial [Ruminococcus sp.]|nr:hypothetical protein [Ruminococcus sp.]
MRNRIRKSLLVLVTGRLFVMLWILYHVFGLRKHSQTTALISIAHFLTSHIRHDTLQGGHVADVHACAVRV